ncbi:hypothetical protein CEXT_620731 [Caerostris extrusa]|uniref:Uncharacterized protein n=1 Tax=Caerostris extrusa TaxID=172846 RepID=A0AAV4MPD8_CAEEX|nr:hypothetical protein CEXT_620731 [Caerostris extrusa]
MGLIEIMKIKLQSALQPIEDILKMIQLTDSPKNFEMDIPINRKGGRWGLDHLARPVMLHGVRVGFLGMLEGFALAAPNQR